MAYAALYKRLNLLSWTNNPHLTMGRTKLQRDRTSWHSWSGLELKSGQKKELDSRARRMTSESDSLTSKKEQIEEVSSEKSSRIGMLGRANCRSFWISFSSAILLSLALATALSISLRSHGQKITVDLPTSVPTVAHSYMLDIVSADDENTRAEVWSAWDEANVRIESKF